MSTGRAAGRLARSLARAAELGSTRFPVAAFSILVFSVLANAEVVNIRLVPQETLGWWIAAVYAAAVASVVAKLALEARAASPGAAQAGSLLGAIVMGAVVRYAEPLGVFAPALVVAISFAIPLAPYVSRPDDRRFWTFTLWTGVGIVLAFLSVLLFLLGVSAILEMVRFLFAIGLGSRAYEHMYTTALTLVGPLMALGRIPADFDESIATTGEDRLADGLRLLFDWVAAPLALATGIVLHVYAAKILMLGELPRNEVGWIVTSFALLVLTLRIAADPFLATGRLFARLFARFWAVMLAVPVGLLVAAIAARVGPEGWTLERYYLALGALAVALLLLLQLAASTRGRIRWIAAVPLVLLVLSSFGPLGVGDTVGRSQTDRLKASIDETGNGRSIREGRDREAFSRLRALGEVDELSRVLTLLPEQERAVVAARIDGGPDGDTAFGASADAIGILADAIGARIEPVVADTGIRVFAASRQPPLSVTGFDVVLPRRAVPGETIEASSVDGPALRIAGMDLVLTVDGLEDRFPLRAVVEAVPASAFLADPSRTMPVDRDLESSAGRVVRLRLQRLALDRANRPSDLAGTILLRRADWPGIALFGGDAETGLAQPGGAIGESPR